MEPLLSVDLNVDYPAKSKVLENLKFEILPREIVGFAGQSGSGKSTVALSILRLLPRGTLVRGHVLFGGRNLLKCSSSEMRRIRGKEIALALQAAASALNPHLRIETQMKEAWKAHEKTSWAVGRRRALDTLAAMDLQCDESFLRRYPSEVSIGQAQRIILAVALLHRPALLIADEPTSALDLVAQLELLRLLKRVNVEFGASILYISHDLGTVRHLCHRICVLNGGRVAEYGTAGQIFDNPSAGFTRDLIAAHHALNSPQECTYPLEDARRPR
ncbi:MAG: ATP-binding cassette domain-containing protein [Bryobacteraceae bacterium]